MTSTTFAPDELFDVAAMPSTAKIVHHVLACWPDHGKFLRASFAERLPRLLQTTETISEMIIRLGATVQKGIDGLAEDYRFLCEQIVYPEELYFRRHGEYRLQHFEDALEQVYANAPFMTRYMHGLLVSDAMWVNHASALDHLAHIYLPRVADGARHLEVGPGHGLLMCLALRSRQIAYFEGWDISETSLSHTRQALNLLDSEGQVALKRRDLFSTEVRSRANAGLFDSIVLSEVLEHVEQPLIALKTLYHLSRPGGLVWVNVPANAPAPDHLFLLRDPAQAAALVKEAGFEVEATAMFPQAGVSIDRAVRQRLAVSCIVVGRKPR